MSTSNIYKGTRVHISRAEPAPEIKLDVIAGEARELGREAGRQEAETAFRVRRDTELTEMQESLDEARRQVEAQRDESEFADAALRELVKVMSRRNAEARARVLDHLGRLSIEIAARIVRWSVKIDPDVIGRTLADCLDRVASDNIRVRAHPEDIAHLERANVHDMDERVIEWICDGSVERGGCVVEADDATLDARLDRQLDRIAEALEGTLTEANETAEATP